MPESESKKKARERAERIQQQRQVCFDLSNLLRSKRFDAELGNCCVKIESANDTYGLIECYIPPRKPPVYTCSSGVRRGRVDGKLKFNTQEDCLNWINRTFEPISKIDVEWQENGF